MSPIIVALDFETQEEALQLAHCLDPALCRVKIASTLFTRYGPDVVQQLQQLGFDVFLDLKYHDIPQQVAGACKQAAEMGVWMLTVHCSGGGDMLRAARQAVDEAAVERKPIIVGVTILTSLSHEDLNEIGFRNSVDVTVLDFANLAIKSGLDGVVCSAAEAAYLRKKLGDQAVLVTPGIRLVDDPIQDQKRVVTPTKAMAAGSSYLVIGRSITKANKPDEVVSRIIGSLDS